MNYGEYKADMMELFLLYGMLKNKEADIFDGRMRTTCSSHHDVCIDRFEFTMRFPKVTAYILTDQYIHDVAGELSDFFSVLFYYDVYDVRLRFFAKYDIEKISVDYFKRANRDISIEFNTDL